MTPARSAFGDPPQGGAPAARRSRFTRLLLGIAVHGLAALALLWLVFSLWTAAQPLAAVGVLALGGSAIVRLRHGARAWPGSTCSRACGRHARVRGLSAAVHGADRFHQLLVEQPARSSSVHACLSAGAERSSMRAQARAYHAACRGQCAFRLRLLPADGGKVARSGDHTAAATAWRRRRRRPVPSCSPTQAPRRWANRLAAEVNSSLWRDALMAQLQLQLPADQGGAVIRYAGLREFGPHTIRCGRPRCPMAAVIAAGHG